MASAVVPLRQSTLESSIKQALFERLTTPVVCVASSARIVLINTAAAKFLELERDLAVGKHLSEVLRYADMGQAARRWVRLWKRLTEHGSVSVPTQLCLRSGAGRAVKLEAQLLRHGSDEVALLVLHSMDAQRQQAREARVRHRREAALQELRCGLSVLLDAEQKILWASAAVSTLAGVDVENLRALPFDYLLDEDSAADFSRMMHVVQSNQTAEVFQAMWRLRGRGGVAGPWLSCRLQNRLHEPGVRAIVFDAVDAQATQDVYQRKSEYHNQLLELALQPPKETATTVRRAVRALGQVLQCRVAGYWQLTTPELSLRCEVQVDCIAEQPKSAERERVLDIQQLPQLPALLTQPEAIALGPEHPLLTSETLFPGTRAVLIAPVVVDDKLYGALIVGDRRHRAWTQDERDLAATAGRAVALALQTQRRQEAETQVEHLAWFDALTDLPNRNQLRELMRQKLSAMPKRQRLAVMLMDLDHFRGVNEAWGHVVGDALLKAVAQAWTQTLGDAGVLVRLGGDEFVALVDKFSHRQEVAQLAARFVQALQGGGLVPQVQGPISASVGVAIFPEHGRDVSALLKNADAAMNQAKRDGRGQFSFFNAVRQERARQELKLGAQLQQALQSDSAGLSVEYQPQVELNSGRVIGLEALIRWDHPTLGRLPPDAFISTAETSGASEQITRWMIHEVCEQIVRWRATMPSYDIPVAVNVAGRELGSSALPLLVRSALLKHRVEPRMLSIEITERTLVQDSPMHNDVVIELAALGVGMVLDDFGTGFSMLGYLKRLPIHALKIDRSFIKGVPADADSCAIVQAVLAVARHFRLKVIAEGIEAQAQADYLRSVGCEYAQGHLYAPALKAAEVAAQIGALSR